MSKKLVDITREITTPVGTEFMYCVDGAGDAKIKIENIGGDMKNSDNLSELTNLPQARINLGVLSETDTKEYAYSTPDFYQYSIVRTVSGGNLTVALKNFEGNDPTPTKPVKIMIGGVVRTITSATSDTRNAGTNWFNLGSVELATKETDLFVYLGYASVFDQVQLSMSRIPYGTAFADFSITSTNEKYNTKIANFTATDSLTNIGRFNAILSGGAGYTWSIPATSVIENRPVYEDSPKFKPYNSQWISSGTQPAIGNGTLTSIYRLVGNKVIVDLNLTPGTTTNFGTGIWAFTGPFTTIGDNASAVVHGSLSAWNGTPFGLVAHKNYIFGPDQNFSFSNQNVLSGAYPFTWSSTGANYFNATFEYFI